MSSFKKITVLMMIAAFVFGKSGAQDQQSATDSKITITNFKVYENNDQLIIDWATDGTVTANYWQLQSSTDGGKQFKTFALVFGPDPRQQGDRYQYKGKVRSTGDAKTIYRVCPVDSNEKEIITEISPAAK